jgi:hypothetical protein
MNPFCCADLADNVIVSHSGTGTLNKPAPYILNRHKVVLFDSVGDAGSPQVVQGEALAADELIVFMGPQSRGERMHGDAAVLAHRLQHHMHTVFVASKADQVLQESRCVAGCLRACARCGSRWCTVM